MKHFNLGESMPRLILILGLVLFGSAQAQTPPSPAPNVDSRGFITCRGFIALTHEQQMIYLVGLRDSWNVAALAIEHNAKSENTREAPRPGMLATAKWMRTMVAHPSATYEEIQKRTQIQCERKANSQKTVWQAWLDAIYEVQQGQKQ